MADAATPAPRFGLRYTLVALLFLGGVALGPGVIVTTVVLTANRLDRALTFNVPGEIDFQATKAGSCIIWDEVLRGSGDQSHSAGTLPSGLAVHVFGLDGKDLAVTSQRGESYSSGRRERQSVYQFEAPSAGKYRVQVAGTFEPRVFCISEEVRGGMWGTLVLALCSGFLGFMMMVGAMALLIITIVRHIRATAKKT